MKKYTFTLILFVLPFLSFNQNVGVGGSLLYNPQSESLGLGARVNILPNSVISFVPQFSYYSIFIGSIREWTLGLSIEAKIIKTGSFNCYLLGHGGYNNWSNAESAALPDATPTNWNLEAGAGITTNWCLRPFLEYRYNIKFQETHAQLGLLYIFGCNNGSGNGYRNSKRIRKMTVCPAYN